MTPDEEMEQNVAAWLKRKGVSDKVVTETVTRCLPEVKRYNMAGSLIGVGKVTIKPRLTTFQEDRKDASQLRRENRG